MLQLAVKSEMPIIQVSTTDMLNVKEVLHHLIPNLIIVSSLESLIGNEEANVGVVFKEFTGMNLNVAYERLLEVGKSLIFVNPKKPIVLAFDAGELPVPKEMILQDLEIAGYSGRSAKKLLPTLSNLTLKEVGEVCKFAQVKFDELTPQGVNLVKRQLFSETQGLIQVDPYLDFYFPDKQLENLLKKEQSFFLECKDHRLIPRGVLLHGKAGVGKSQAAKYFAREWGISLFLLDLSSIMGKYVGQSEKGMMSMLRRIDSEEPAILLIDEVEKMFKSDGDSGTTTRLLGQLLWWLAERRTRIFVMMTSNDLKALPKELYRPGRIDELIELEGLAYDDGVEFVKKIMQQFDGEFNPIKINKMYPGIVSGDHSKKVSHALLVKTVKDSIKDQLMEKGEF